MAIVESAGALRVYVGHWRWLALLPAGSVVLESVAFCAFCQIAANRVNV
jgi:hypothetical protein